MASSTVMRRVLYAAVCFGIAFLIAFVYDAKVTRWASFETRKAHILRSSSKSIQQSATLPIENLRSAVQQSRQQIITELEKDYGRDAFYDIFYEDKCTVTEGGDASDTATNCTKISRGRAILTSVNDPRLTNRSDHSFEPSPSWTSLVHKIALKILQAHHVPEAESAKETNTKLVWATGGNSQAAGHGNFMNEAFTYVMTARLTPLFQSLGIEFEGRNYGMSGSRSAPEVSICSAEIYGQDVDILSWNFGITDLRSAWRVGHYFWRAIHAIPNRPVLMTLFLGSDSGSAKRYLDVLKDLHEKGAPILVQNENVNADCHAAIPETAGLSESQLGDMPKVTRNFKCNGFLESGEPYCRKERFNMSMCTDRKYMVNWHQGWRAHALQGDLLTVALADAVEDALAYLAEEQESGTSPMQTLQSLEANDLQTFDDIRAASLPTLASQWSLPEDVDRDWIWREPSVCRTARAPAQSRLLGISTNSTSDVKLGSHLQGQGDYYVGIPRILAESEFSTENGEMRLVQDDYRHLKAVKDCEETWLWDFYDNYYIHQREGWKYLLLPNEAEERAYLPEGRKLRGIIAICMKSRDARIPANGSKEIGKDDNDFVADQLAEILVNGEVVTSLFDAGDCRFLQHSNSSVWKANQEGRFEVRARVLKSDRYMLLSSIVVW